MKIKIFKKLNVLVFNWFLAISMEANSNKQMAKAPKHQPDILKLDDMYACKAWPKKAAEVVAKAIKRKYKRSNWQCLAVHSIRDNIINEK